MIVMHGSDLHLNSEEEEYGFSVLEEIIEATAREKAEFLLLCGDIFDSYKEARNLRTRFRKALSRLPGSCRVLFLPGNHERLRAGNGRLDSLDFGRAELLDGLPFTLAASETVEFLAVPSGTGIGRRMKVPEKKTRFRILMAHGVVFGMHYAGPGEETGETGMVDPEFFKKFSIDYAAMGHIHSPAEQKFGGCSVVFPGSSRVWRKGESNPRRIVKIILPPPSRQEEIRWEPVFLERAGQYRKVELPLEPDGTGVIDFSSFYPEDYIDLVLSGTVEDEKRVAALETALHARGSTAVRKLEIDRTGISVVSGISSQPMVRQFLERWKSLEPADGSDRSMRIWYRARELALREIMKVLEARN